MNRIWQIEWYNEDEYGTTQLISVVVQGEDIDSKQATEEARNKIFKQYENFDFNKYEKFRAVEVTNETILSVNSFNFI